MDTVHFLSTILPSEGLLCVATPQPEGGFKHRFGPDVEWMDNVTAHLDAREAVVYFALASFKTDANRKGTNVHAVRSFWVDLDVGQDKPYPTARAAATDIVGFATKVGLPAPWLVASGRGVHAYWPMDADMTPAAWKATATVLKAALKAEGVGQDPSRTSDIVSVLRPPGTTHRKGEPRPVKVMLESEVLDLNTFQQALLPYAALVEMESDDPLGPRPDHISDLGSNDDLSQGITRRPSSSARIAEGCGVLALMRDTQGNVDQPTWYHSLGVMAYTDDGIELAHTWSSGHPDYSRDETLKKLAQQAKVGAPTSCAKLSDYQPAICAACSHSGNIKTPWSLGQYDPEAKPILVQKLVPVQTGGFRLINAEVDHPYGFRVAKDPTLGKDVIQGHVAIELPDGSSSFRFETFCETAFWPVSRLWIEDVAHVECEMDLADHSKRRFVLDAGIIGKGKDGLAGELARNEIVPQPNKGRIVDAYLQRWLTQLKDKAPMHVAYRHFGWTSDRSFVLGDTVLHPGGAETRAILVGMAKSLAEPLKCKGSLDVWVDAVDKVYNAPGQEAFQFLVATGFAAPLLRMMDQVSGLTVYAHSEGSGVGKTTAQKVALSAWGDWEELMLADAKVTPNAMWAMMGASHSLPIVFDELTNQKNDVASELVFSVSSGRSKKRLQADGEMRSNNSNWCTILLASGNTLLSEKLALHRGNAEAEISRLFEFTLRATSHLSPNDANALFPKLLASHGHAGRVFIKYVVDNYDAVTKLLLDTQARLNTQLRISRMERYWSALLASTLVATSICRSLGLLQFDLIALRTWMVDRLGENRVQRNSAATDPLELLGSMLTDLWQGILVTAGEGDLRKNQMATVIEKPRGPLVGRAILASGGNTTPVLLLNRQAVRDWANKKGVSAREMFDAAVAAGWADKDTVRYALGRGTVEYASTSSYIGCWKLNPDLITGMDAGKLLSEKFTTVNGGLSNAAGSSD